MIPVTRLYQDHLHSVIQFALNKRELWKSLEDHFYQCMSWITISCKAYLRTQFLLLLLFSETFNSNISAHFTSFFALAQNHHHQVVLDIVEKLDGENPRKGHRTTIEHAGFFTQAQVFLLLTMWRSFLF